MATEQAKSAIAAPQSRFNWGETVRLRQEANVPDRAGAIAAVCGIAVIQTAEHATSVVGGSIGKEAYLIEFQDGQSLEVVSHLLDTSSDSDE